MTDEQIEQRVNELVAKKMAELAEEKKYRTKKLALIASKGSLDWAYPPFILASAAVAMGWDVSVFFTFYGLLLLRKDYEPAVSPLGNPAMPMKMPFGPEEFQKVNWKIPTLVQSLPGFHSMATNLMKQTFANKGVASIQELRNTCTECGVKLIACQMTMDVFGFTKEDFIPDVTVAGAASFLSYASDADVQLFI